MSKKYNFNIIVDSKNPLLLNDKIQLCEFEYSLFLPKNVSIRHCTIEDINDSENFFYVLNHWYDYPNFPDNIKNAITYKGLKVIFFSFHESPFNLEEFIKLLFNDIKNNNWNESQFYFINNNSLLNVIKEKFNTQINFYKLNSLLRVTSEMTKPIITEKDILFDKKFIFLCLNRNPTANHRIALLTYLKNYNLLENDISDWSWVTGYNNESKKIQSINHIKKYISIDDKKLIKDYLEISNEKKLSYYEQNVNWFENKLYLWSPDHNTLDTFKNSYINIVTETEFNFLENNIQITEKTFKPFYFFQLPIFLATYNHVKMLRNEYDLDLFDDLIDHSYDDEIDDIKRFHMVLNEIQRLSNMRDEISKYYKLNIDKIIDNHNFIKTYSEKQIEENYFSNLIR